MSGEKEEKGVEPRGTHCLVPHDLMMALANLVVSLPYAQVVTIAPQVGMCEWVTLPENPMASLKKAKATKKKAKKKKRKR